MVNKQRAGLYLRVSTGEQNMEGQESELKEYAEHRGWEVTKIYRDTISGSKNRRPELDKLMVDAHKRRIDIVQVWRFDRFARSVSHLLSALEQFRSAGIEFVSVSEQIDTSTPGGRLTFRVLAAVSELERSLITERVRMGIQNARRKGVRLGRPPLRTLSSNELQEARKDRMVRKLSLRALAKKYGTSVWAAQQIVTGMNLAA